MSFQYGSSDEQRDELVETVAREIQLRGLTGPALQPMRLFHVSNLYLALLFVAVAVDPLVGG